LFDKKLEMVVELEAGTRPMAEQDDGLKYDVQDAVVGSAEAEVGEPRIETFEIPTPGSPQYVEIEAPG